VTPFTRAPPSGLAPAQHGQPPESLLALAEYLELALDEGECVVLMRQGAGVCAVHIGDPTGLKDDLAVHGTIAAALADGMLTKLTQRGVNRITIGDQIVRSVMHIANDGAVVFAPA
jgi:hypothetical protein